MANAIDVNNLREFKNYMIFIYNSNNNDLKS